MPSEGLQRVELSIEVAWRAFGSSWNHRSSSRGPDHGPFNALSLCLCLCPCLCQAVSLSPSHSLTPLFVTLSLHYLSLSHSRTPLFLTLSLSLSLSPSLSLSISLSLSLTHSLTHSRTLSLSLARSLARSLSLSLCLSLSLSICLSTDLPNLFVYKGRRAKRDMLNDQLQQAWDADRQGDKSAIWQVIRRLAPKTAKTRVQLRGPQGELLTQQEETDRFVAYCQKVYHAPPEPGPLLADLALVGPGPLPDSSAPFDPGAAPASGSRPPPVPSTSDVEASSPLSRSVSAACPPSDS